MGHSGRRCNSRVRLQIDHIVPFSRGGRHNPSNLRLLCSAHNLLAAEQAYGRDVMAGYARRQ
ncbi:MAG TPA: HNH endonuclease [Halothiobacillaceae bacterium]|nr:HNH endonuclease [Halothiobacillaceae bacterium]